ncbi:MAG: SsrA-binding protein SmpB [Chloroflexi bacterium]|nr:SsrA-binding protein SmpB [Chloroflexota bacterium]
MSDPQVLATNRRAFRDYFIDETLESGIALVGSEIKSARAGQINLKESYAAIRDRQAWLLGAHIAPYNPASGQNHEPTRDRRLLLHRREIIRLSDQLQQKGYTLVPLRVYLKRNHIKLELGLARGKKQFDKRQVIAEHDAKREIERAIKYR